MSADLYMVEVEKVNKAIEDVIIKYKQVFEAGRMEFSEYEIIENVLYSLNFKLKDIPTIVVDMDKCFECMEMEKK